MTIVIGFSFPIREVNALGAGSVQEEIADRERVLPGGPSWGREFWGFGRLRRNEQIWGGGGIHGIEVGSGMRVRKGATKPHLILGFGALILNSILTVPLTDTLFGEC